MYNPKIWYDGDIVTSGGLNNIEQGIAQNAHDIEDLQSALGGSSVSIDDTLTVSGAAADAKAAGDRISDLDSRVTDIEQGIAQNTSDISELKEELTVLDEDVYAITPTQVSTNLANTIDIVSGKVINSSGNLVDNSQYKTSTVFIPIDPTKTYSARGLTFIAIYDANQTFLRRISGPQIGTFSQGDAFIKITSNSNTTLWQLNEGSTLLPYEAYFHPIPETKTSKIATNANDIAEINARLNNTSIYNKYGTLKTHRCDFAKYYVGKQNSYANFVRTTTYAEVISAMDALVSADPNYVSKIALGTASGTDAGENAYTMYEYVFKPYISTAIQYKATPKVLIDGCIHGFEKCSTYAFYYFLKDLVENFEKSDVLTAIRSQVEIHFIPVVNPYGFDNLTYKNANSVNINRNFGTDDWTYIDISSSDASGNEPFDQPESAIIRDWINANADAVCYINGHTNGQYNAGSFPDANACMCMFNTITESYYRRLAYVIDRHIELQTQMISKEYTINTGGDNWGRFLEASAHGGMAANWATEKAHVLGMILEGFNGVQINGEKVVVYMSDNAKKINAEMFGNMIAQILYEYSEA